MDPGQLAAITLRRLMDGVEDGVIDQITATIAAVPRVQQVGRVRARWSGHRLEADVNVSVDADLTVLESRLHVADPVGGGPGGRGRAGARDGVARTEMT